MLQKLLIAAALSVVLFAPIRTSLPLVAVAAAGGDPVIKTIVGWASYYGPGFHGRRTASGEIFDMHELVAAHRTLPLGTVARVTNLSNGRSVVVRINDRGPYIKGRILDVSKGAATSLAFVRNGLARVRIDILAKRSDPRNPWFRMARCDDGRFSRFSHCSPPRADGPLTERGRRSAGSTTTPTP